MNSRWLMIIVASVPVIAATLALQSCAGLGGPVTGGGTDNVAAQFLALLSSDQRTASYIGAEACASCHGGTGRSHDDPIFAHWEETVHAQKGVNCESCHGPGSVHRDNPTQGNILTYPLSTSPIVCGQCHGTIHDQFNFSAHAKIVTNPVQSAVTNPEGARSSRCISCHSGLFRAEIIAHGVNVATMPSEKIRQVAENTITHTPHIASCVTCHNPHSKTGNLNDEGKEVQLRRKVFNTDVSQVGPSATPEMFTNFDHTCAQCHNGRGVDPSDPRLQASTARPMHSSLQYNMLMGFGGVEGSGPVQRNTAHATAPGQCSKCHMPDSRHTFTVSFDKGCSPCHTAPDAAARATSIKSEILSSLVNLRNRLGSWASAQFDNSLFWDYTTIIQGEGYTPPPQAQIPIEIKRARHNYYFVVRAGDFGVHNAPYAKHLIKVANDNLDALNVAKPASSRMATESALQIIQRDRARASRADQDSFDD
jgi:hypothetical protein